MVPAMESTFFQKISLFSQASADSLEKLSQMAKWHFYKKGDVILTHQRAKDSLLYVIDGWIKLSKESANGAEIIVDILTQGYYCGELFIFQSDTQDSYMAQAVSDVEVVILPIKSLKQLLVSDQQISLNFLQASLEKQQQLNMTVEHLSIQSAVQRVGCFILRLCSIQHNKDITLHFPYNKSLLASRLGMRIETFSRALSTLSKACNIKVSGEMIYIADLNAVIQYICQHCSKTFPCKTKSNCTD